MHEVFSTLLVLIKVIKLIDRIFLEAIFLP